MPDRTDDFEAMIRVARMTRVEAGVLYEWIQREIVIRGASGWDDEEAVEAAQRARRLSELGLNAAGIEVAMHMRAEMIRLRREIAAIDRQLRELRRQHEQELARLARELVGEADWSP
jgi:hypothetical protein